MRSNTMIAFIALTLCSWACAQVPGETYPECIGGSRQLSEPSSAGLHFQPHIARDPQGNSLVVYVREDLGSYSVVGRLLGPLGEIFSDEFYIHLASGPVFRPQAVYITDFFTVTWQSSPTNNPDNGDNIIQGLSLKPTGVFSTPATVGPVVEFAQNCRSQHEIAYKDGVLMMVFDYLTGNANASIYGLKLKSFDALNDAVVDEYDTADLTVSDGVNCDGACNAREPGIAVGSDLFMILFDYGDQDFGTPHDIVVLPTQAQRDSNIFFPNEQQVFVVANSITPNGTPGHDHHVRVEFSSQQNYFIAVWEIEEFSSNLVTPTGNHYIGAVTFSPNGQILYNAQNVHFGRFEQNWDPEVAYLEADDTFYVAYETGGALGRHYIAGTTMKADTLEITWQVESLSLDTDDEFTATLPTIVDAPALDGFLVSYQVGPVAMSRKDTADTTAASATLPNTAGAHDSKMVTLSAEAPRAIDVEITHYGPRKSHEFTTTPESAVKAVPRTSVSSTGKRGAIPDTIQYTGLCGDGAYDDEDSSDGYSNLVLLYPLLLIAITICALAVVIAVVIAFVLNNGKAQEAIQTLSEKAKGTENLESFYNSDDGDMGQL